MSRRVQDLPGRLLLLAFLGALGLYFGAAVGYWWLAHHMAWWTYATFTTGTFLGITFVKALIKEIRS